MSSMDKIFSCRLKGIELNIFRGNIVMAETDAIAILCDHDLKLFAGVGRTVRNTGGQDFVNSVSEQKRKQRGSRVISVPVTSGIRAGCVLLAPVSAVDRHSFQQIYIAIIQKAIDLRIESLSMPLLGSGGFLSSISAASNHMWTGLEHFSSFGRLKKIQFIDTNDFHMRSLHKFIISKLRAHTQIRNGSSASSHSTSDQSDNSRISLDNSHIGLDSSRMSSSTNDNDHSFRLIGSGTSQSPIELFRPGRDIRIAARNNSDSSESTREHNRINSLIEINITIASEQETQPSSDESGTSLSTDAESGNSSASDNSDLEVSGDDAEMASNDSDQSDAMDSDDDIESVESSEAMGLDSDVEEQSDDDFADGRGRALTMEQESQYWTVVPIEQLRADEGPSQVSDKPSTSSVMTTHAEPAASQSKRFLSSQRKSQLSSSPSMRHPNVCLDDSSMPCSICLSDMREDCDDVVVHLSLCSHLFHKECIKSAFAVKRQCPLCMLWYGECIGYQPANATMTIKQVPGHVPGHRDAKGFHEITYHVPAGIQIEGHIRPGQPYSSTTRFAFLPNNAEGTRVLKLLQLAFTRRLIFTIGDSVTTGRKNVPVWNNIHHKTSRRGGPQNYGYPDPAYLERVKEELSVVGVRIDQVN